MRSVIAGFRLSGGMLTCKSKSCLRSVSVSTRRLSFFWKSILIFPVRSWRIINIIRIRLKCISISSFQTFGNILYTFKREKKKYIYILYNLHVLNIFTILFCSSNRALRVSRCFASQVSKLLKMIIPWSRFCETPDTWSWASCSPADFCTCSLDECISLHSCWRYCYYDS